MDNTKIFKGYENIFAERLRLLMKQHSTKQTDLAEYLGLTRQAISKYADGSVLPNIENLERICKYFNVSSDYLIGLSDSDSFIFEERYITDTTGLNATSINTLKHYFSSENKFQREVIAFTNEMLHSIIDLGRFSEHLENCYKMYVAKQGNDEEDSVIAFNKAIWRACDWFDETFEDVTKAMYDEDMKGGLK